MTNREFVIMLREFHFFSLILNTLLCHKKYLCGKLTKKLGRGPPLRRSVLRGDMGGADDSIADTFLVPSKPRLPPELDDGDMMESKDGGD